MGGELGGRDRVFGEDVSGGGYGFIGLHASSADGLVDPVHDWGVGVFDGHVLCWVASWS